MYSIRKIPRVILNRHPFCDQDTATPPKAEGELSAVGASTTGVLVAEVDAFTSAVLVAEVAAFASAVLVAAVVVVVVAEVVAVVVAAVVVVVGWWYPLGLFAKFPRRGGGPI